MQAVVGLGNSGRRYARTRHNMGFFVVNRLADDLGSAWEEAPTYCLARAVCEDKPLLLAKPTTYMNSSGTAVVDVIERFDLALEDVLVIVDDVHLDLGRLRFRRRGTHGGHNGLRSIIETIGASDFPRLRVGIGFPTEVSTFIDYVLGEFDREEQDLVEQSVQTAIEGILCWLTQGLDVSMNRFNAA